MILELEGDFETVGFRATLEIRAEPRILKVKGYLPAAPEVATQHRHWQQTYRSLGMPLRIKAEKIIHKGSLNRRILDCQESAQVLRNRFRDWLNSQSFQSIDRRLREELNRDDTIRFLIRTNDLSLQKLPWHEWDFFERYPKAEVALSAPEYEAIHSQKLISAKATVKVLAILGNSQGISLERDRQLLEQLPQAEIEFLVEPDRQQLSDRLWNESWDILFFAGHSRTEGESGRIYINETDSFTLTELKYGLRQAIDRGLQLAIFNSCDGLGLAQELHQLRIPQLIVMREPIADQVAAVFLQYFLAAFAAGESLYLAERQARERLQGLEHQFPCASWLPIIFQNLLVTPPDWRSLCGNFDLPATPISPSLPRMKPRWRSTLWISLLVTFAVLAIRSIGLLQPIELAAYDHLMRLRPAEAIDPRILVVEVTQADVNQQGGYPLTDATLVKAIAALQSLEPVAIGLDMHRFQPRGAGRPDLIAQFQQNSKLITVCAFNSDDRNYAAPPEFSSDQQIEQVGFSNLAIDRFSVWRPASRSDIQTATAQPEGSMVRRQILSYDPNLAPLRSTCTTPYSLSFQLAYRYLRHANVQPLHVNEWQQWQFGAIAFRPLPDRFVGYQSLDGSNQIMLNYRAAPPGQQVSLQQVLDGEATTEMVRDRIVLIGYTAPVARDSFDTPYGEMAGVWVHAHAVSQILSAVQDQRSQIRSLPQWRNLQWGDATLILAVSLVTSMLVKRLRSNLLWLGVAIAILSIMLHQISLISLTGGIWLPFIPALFAIFLSAIGVISNLELQRKLK
ncbi:CHASE2 domain-containing protein [Leptolyngbya sp. FACHB-1515]|uniref:CHASE2 domain-containing protein n=1 Tax=Leptolyngbya sp. FACHB-1515 TaxID=2933931 RepID=UPI00329910BC